MIYLHALWHHDSCEDPVDLWSELDDERWEIRKVERYPDGTLGCAGPDISCINPTTALGELPLPPLDEIATDPEFSLSFTTKEAFDEQWQRALAAVNVKAGE